MKKSHRSLSKLTLIPVLVVVLGYRIVSLTGVPEQGDAVGAVETLAVGEKAPRGKSDVSSPDKLQLSWPTRSLVDVLKHDPFAAAGVKKDDNLLDAVADHSTATKTAMPEARLKVIYRTSNGAVALVGSEVVREGQHLKDGSLVVAIRDDEVILRPGPAGSASSAR